METLTRPNLTQLRRCLGDLAVSHRSPTEDDLARYKVDGLAPSIVVEPASPEAVAAILEACAAEGAAVVPIGAATNLSLGNVPRAYDVALLLSGLAGIIEYNAADMTVRAGAGTRLGDLQALLAAEGQMLALDPPEAKRSTVGGVIAANGSGPMRLKYGSVRDLLIGIQVAEPSGLLTRSGGKVVKNVAGYDLNKLYTGSLGTLAVITEATFKLHPIPDGAITYRAAFPSAEAADRAARELLGSPYAPSRLRWHGAFSWRPDSAPPEAGDGAMLYARVEGFERSREFQAEQVRRLLAAAGASEPHRLNDRYDDGVWLAARTRPDDSEEATHVKLAGAPADSLALYRALTSAAEQAGIQQIHKVFPGSGVVLGHLNGSADAVAGVVRRIRGEVAPRGGSVVVEAAPVQVKRLVDVWGDVGPTLRLMQGLKRRYDPNGILNPGRFVGGI